MARTTPAPQVPGLAQDIADLARRLRSLERAPRGAGPVELQVGCWPYSGGDTTRWARSTDSGWAQHWVWHQPLRWLTHTVLARGASDAGVSYQLRVTCDRADPVTLWTSEVLTGAQLVGGPIPLAQVLATAAGQTARFAIEARVAAGADAVFTVPEQVAFSQPCRA